MTTQETKEVHVQRINDAIDAILDLEGHYSQLPNDLTKALTKLNSLRNAAEEEIEQVLVYGK